MQAMVDWYAQEQCVVRPGWLYTKPFCTIAERRLREKPAKMVVPGGYIEIAEKKNGKMRPGIVREPVQLYSAAAFGKK